MRTTLGMEFGTKRAKKAIASMTENAITRKSADGVTPSDSLTTAVLNSLATNTASIPTREEKQAIIDRSKPRPKANLAATTPAEVYTLDEVIGEETLRDIAVKGWVEENSIDGAFNASSRFVASRVHYFARDEDVLQLKALRYMYMLIQFYLALKPEREGQKKLPTKADLAAKVDQASTSLLDGIKRKYAEGGFVSSILPN
jgi:DNA-directed RNA polymerase I subunit RPA49